MIRFLFRKSSPLVRLRNQRGQGLVEYLVIVALMGVATIAIVRTMGSVVSSRFASVAAALQGDKVKGTSKVQIDQSSYKKRDMGDFFNGVEGSSGTSSGSRSGGSQYVGAE